MVADYISRDSALNSSLSSAITTSAGHTSNYIDANKYTDDKVKTVLATSAGNNMAWNNSTKRFDVSFNSDYNSLNNKLTAGHNIDINANNVVSAVLDIYNGDSTINGNLTVNSNFVVLGTTTTLNVNNNSTDIFTASNIGPGPTLSVIQTSQINNIVNISNYLDKEVFNITSEGHINFSEKINGIDKTQFSKIANIDANDSYCSNFVRIGDDILFLDYSTKIDDLRLYVETNDNFTSNYVRGSSNLLFTDYIGRISANSLWTKNGTHIYNNNTNNVGIGTTEPSAYKLHVVGSIGASGDITASYSDERLKNITEYINDVLPILSKINVFRYNCNDIGEKYGYDKSKKELGLSAQEIQKYYPELVSLAPFDTDYDPEKQKIISKSGEEYLTLNYERLVPVLLQGIKELKQEINELKVRLSKLE